MKTRHFAAFTDSVMPHEASHGEIAYLAATEAIVLLENDGTLPLIPGRIALYGAGAGMTIKGGTGSGEVYERHDVTVLEGMEKAGFTVTTKKWIDDYAEMFAEEERAYGELYKKKITEDHPYDVLSIMEPFRYPYGRGVTESDIKSSDTDTCIYIVSRQAGEGVDRKLDNGDNSLSEIEKENISVCAASYRKFIVAVNVGSSFDMSSFDGIEGINAIIFMGQLGSRGGDAFADVISGKVTPSGKLTDTWAKSYKDIPYSSDFSYLNGDLENEYYREGIYVGYRYFDSYKKAPRYHFGYGLSYTDFKISKVKAALDGTIVKIKALVTNSGTRFEGKEVVQVYVSCPQEKTAKEYQRLAAFAKTSTIAPGMSETVNLSFDMKDMASFVERRGAFVLDAGTYIIRVGNCSAGTKVCGAVDLDKEAVISRHDKIFTGMQHVRELPAAKITYPPVPKRVTPLKLSAAAFTTEKYEYKTPEIKHSRKMDKLMKELSLKDMARLCVGDTVEPSGKRFITAPGSAGYTTDRLLKKKIPNAALADGPAGLRLIRRSCITEDKEFKFIDPYMKIMEFFPDEEKAKLFGDPEKDTLIYQYTTAFPVEICLAQTWNLHLAEEVGYAASEEMSVYGVSYWLAPAQNIHRNPLCGRNFEYFSEDPYLSGKMAAAIVRGVQKIPGNFATIKHFCCNNQEDNRNRTNANVNERALREIYLKGFEIAVKESAPAALMTSYNKVNGKYVNNNYELITKVLRNEWGFNGLVMTDWVATGDDLGDDALCMAAGNDLIMPGMPDTAKNIVKGVKEGVISKKDVRRCAANVLDGIMKTRVYRLYKNK